MKKETFLGAIVLIGIWMLANWFKVLVGIVLISLVFLYRSYTQNNAQLACTQFGVVLDEKLSKQIEKSNTDDKQLHVQYGDVSTPPSEKTDMPQTEYKFKNGICYGNVTVSTHYGATPTYSIINSHIEDSYTQEVLSGCSIKTSDISSSSCEKYYKSYDKIFSNLYGI